MKQNDVFSTEAKELKEAKETSVIGFLQGKQNTRGKLVQRVAINATASATATATVVFSALRE